MIKQVQIDFLPVDSGEKSGDAIAFRYGDFSQRSNYKVVVIDGGTIESGNNLVKHIKEYFETDHVDLVVCTHPDADHASGLRQVMNQCSVGELWIHQPWNHSEEILHLFHDGRITDQSLDRRLREAYTYAHELVQLAEEKGIDTREPFAGRQSEDECITVLGPTTDYYRELIPEFTKSPQAKSPITEALRGFTKAITWIRETILNETLDETGVTSAVNSSSAVLLLEFNGNKFLFTGDAGIPSLKKVIRYAAENGIDISHVNFMQVPHHGSKRNISPSILNAIRCDRAYVSVSKHATKHPARKVTNAFTRRGAKVFRTNGETIGFNINASRGNWGPIDALPFYDQVEE